MQVKRKPSREIAEEPESNEDDRPESVSKKNEVKFRGPKKKFIEKEEKSSPVRETAKATFTRNLPIKLNYSNFMVRTVWTIIMLLAFIAIILAGHFYCSVFVLILSVGMVKEILSLKRDYEKDLQTPFSQTVTWYWCVVAIIFFYGKLFSNKLPAYTLSNIGIYNVVLSHNFICFALWIIGFLMFTISLKKGYYKYQFRQFAWLHIAVFLIMGQTSAIVNNIYEGLIWFIIPCLLVIANDTFAYIFGFFFGKTRLIELSPKKTVEGFIGGFISTLVFAFIFSVTLCKFQALVCPKHEISFVPFEFATCEVSNVFVPYERDFSFLGIPHLKIKIAEFQIHALILAGFASLIAPFGGFFASGFKRAIKVKDFADIIPGHGGITDRMDCQILTGMFAYLYVHQIVYGKINYVSGVIGFITNQMETGDQLLLYNELKDILYSRGLLNVTMSG